MYNKVILIGNLTRDPEIRYTPQGTPVTNFSLALNRKYKAGEELREEVSYFDIVVFGKQAETSSQYLNKGSSVLIDGRLQQRRWEDKDTGQKRSKVEVVAENVRFMPKRGQAAGGEAGSAYRSEGPPPEITDDEVPF